MYIPCAELRRRNRHRVTRRGARGMAGFPYLGLAEASFPCHRLFSGDETDELNARCIYGVGEHFLSFLVDQKGEELL